MKRLLSLLVLASATLVGVSASAAPVFMLQFGSFESQTEAEQKLEALKTKHAGVLSRLQSGVRQVTLPPDNLSVYRTQAGPLATRADAQSVCSQLAGNGDECYVVETAVAPSFIAAATPAQQAPAEATPPTAEGANVEALNRITAVADATPPAAAPAAEQASAEQIAPATTTEADAAVQHDLAVAAERQNAGLPPLDKPVKKRRSVWDRLFGRDEETPAPAPVAAAAVADTAAPVEPVSVAANPAPVAAEVAAALPPVPASAPELAAAETQPPAAQALRLPPPPAPLTAAPQPASAQPVVAAAAPAAVQVEEAQRVPLTQQQISQSNLPAVGAPALMPASVDPSAVIGRKTLWAQIGPFHSEEEARAYWEQYRLSHPDFPVVRVRVTSPMQAYTRGVAYTTLRVGPFAQYGFVYHLCSTLAGKENHVQCSPVVDLGQPSGALGQRSALPASRYRR